MNKLIQWLKLRLIAAPRHRLKWLFSMEARCIRRKGRIPDTSDKPSVFFFSTHKCASTFLNQLIRDLSQREHRIHIDPETYLATRPDKWEKLRTDKDFKNELLHRKGYYFGVFRNAFTALPLHSDQKIILVLRDPRDVLTSQFFSIAYSHPVLTARFLNKRIHALETGIDRHVLEMSERFIKTYSEYIAEYLGRKDVLFIRYEDLISSFPQELARLLDFVGHTAKEETLRYWLANNPFMQEAENIHRHKRKMVPGDHLEKLRPETIAELNIRFGKILAALGYN